MTLSDLGFNQAVSLADDPGFLGYVVGRGQDDEQGNAQILLSISKAGNTGLRGCKPFALSQLRPIRGPVIPARGAMVR